MRTAHRHSAHTKTLEGRCPGPLGHTGPDWALWAAEYLTGRTLVGHQTRLTVQKKNKTKKHLH